MSDITHELRNFMRNKGYTQESLAKQLDVSQARIQQLLAERNLLERKQQTSGMTFSVLMSHGCLLEKVR